MTSRFLVLLLSLVIGLSGGCTEGGTSPVYAVKVPNDPSYLPKQWYLQERTASNPGGANLPGAWAITTGDSSLYMGVIDSEFNLEGPDFKGDPNCRPRFEKTIVLSEDPTARPDYETVPGNVFGHGSIVTAILGRCTNNGIEGAGVDWSSRIQPFNFAEEKRNQKNLGLWIEFLAGYLHKSKIRIDVINVSLGGAIFHPAQAFNAPEYFNAVNSLNANKQVLVAGSGNDHTNAALEIPATVPGVITVGASTKEGIAAQFSNWGKAVDVLAPGDGIWITDGAGPVPNPRIETARGTSLATPIVSGVVMLMKSVNPGLATQEIRYILRQTAVPMSCEQYCSKNYDVYPGARKKCQDDCCVGEKNICSAGLLDAYQAVKMAKEGISVPLPDVNPYLLILHGAGPHVITVENVGRAKGEFQLVSSDARITLDKATLSLDAGEKATVQVSSSEKKVFHALVSIRALPFKENDPLSSSIDVHVVSTNL